MANKIGNIPSFTGETPSSESLTPAEQQELKEKYGENQSSVLGTEKASPEASQEKENPADPTAEEKPDGQAVEDIGAEKEKLARELAGLQKARRELVLELADLRGDRKDAKQQQINQVQQQIDDLKDLNQQDVNTIDRILKAKGYVSQESVSKMLYESQKQSEINSFLNQFPQYNEKNDPAGVKFGQLLQELKLYKEPQNSTQFGELLRRAHAAIGGESASSERVPTVQQRRAQIAGVGAGGAQRSSSVKSFSPEKRQRLLDGGWSEEDVKRMEQNQK